MIMKRNTFLSLLIVFNLMDMLFYSCANKEKKNKEEHFPRNEEYHQGWYKSKDNPLVIFEGNLEIAPKNCVNSPVVLPIDDCPYKNYKWAFLHLDTNPETYENYLSITFSTDDGFNTDHWEDELRIIGKIAEPFDAKIIDGKIYLWGTWPREHKNHNEISVMTSENWIEWSEPVSSIVNDKSWRKYRARGFTIQKVPEKDQYLALFSGQSDYGTGAFSIGRAIASTKQIKENQWTKDSDNPVFTSKDISWNGKDVVLYPRLLPRCSNGQWIMAMASYLNEPNRFSVGFVYSDDNGKNWKEYLPGTNPVLIPGPETWDAGYVSTPYVIETGTRSYKMYYGARPEIMKYHAIGIAYLGPQTEFGDCAVAINRQIGWENLRFRNMGIRNISPYENDMSDELVQMNPGEDCEIVTPVVDLGEGRHLTGGKNGTRIYACNISEISVEVRGYDQPPAEKPQTEWRKGYIWYEGWGKTKADDFKKYSLKKGRQPDEYYISGSCPDRYVQMRISSSARVDPLILDEIVFCNQ